MPEYYLRTARIRAALAREHVRSKLRDEHPEIPYLHEGNRFVVITEGVGTADETTPPCGVVFKDGSFLTLYERWSKPEDKLLAYSYHYQRKKASVRYDMDENPRPGVPKCHVQFSGLKDVHAPSGGQVSIEQVLDMIAEQFLKKRRPR